MSRVQELAGRLRHLEAGIAAVQGQLDQSQTPCSHCGIMGRSNQEYYYAAVSLEGAMSRIRKAVSGLREEQ